MDHAEPTGAGTLPAATRLGTVSLRVADLDAVAAFYRSVAGLSVRDDDDGSTADARREELPSAAEDRDRLTLGTAERAIVDLVADPDAPEREPTAAGLYHLAIRYPDRAALGAAAARAQSAEAGAIQGASDHGFSEALYLADPEGNGVELYCDRPRSEWPRTASGGVALAPPEALDLDRLADVARRVDGAVSSAATEDTDLGHVHLEVGSLAAARAFYVDALGFDVTMRTERGLFVAAGDYHHHVALNTWRGRSTRAGVGRGVIGYSVVLPDPNAVAEVRDRVARSEVGRVVGGGAGPPAPAPAVATGEGPLVLEDPDGVRLRIESA